MKAFYLLRHEDVHGNSGLGTVAEGTIYHNGLVSMTWLTKYKTVTVFQNITQVRDLHAHGGKTEIVIEGMRGKKNQEKFELCRTQAHERKIQLKKTSTEAT